MERVAVRMPKFGMTMEAGIIVEWLAQPGDSLSEGEGFAVITTEKVEVELEASASGKLTELCVELDEEVPVGDVVAWIESEEAE